MQVLDSLPIKPVRHPQEPPAERHEDAAVIVAAEKLDLTYVRSPYLTIGIYVPCSRSCHTHSVCCLVLSSLEVGRCKCYRDPEICLEAGFLQWATTSTEDSVQQTSRLAQRATGIPPSHGQLTRPSSKAKRTAHYDMKMERFVCAFGCIAVLSCLASCCKLCVPLVFMFTNPNVPEKSHPKEAQMVSQMRCLLSQEEVFLKYLNSLCFL